MADEEFVMVQALVRRTTRDTLKAEARRRRIPRYTLAGIVLDAALENAEWGEETSRD